MIVGGTDTIVNPVGTISRSWSKVSGDGGIDLTGSTTGSTALAQRTLASASQTFATFRKTVTNNGVTDTHDVVVTFPGLPGCIETQDFGCLASEAYEAKLVELATEWRGDTGFSNQWGLEDINADDAWARIQLAYGADTKPGAGQTLGLIDTALDANHPAFAGKTVTRVPSRSSHSHGTAVASVMAGDPPDDHIADRDAPRGVAYGADITNIAVNAGSGGTYTPLTLSQMNGIDSSWSRLFATAASWSAGGRTLDFVNVSLAWNGSIELYTEDALRENFDATIAALAQAGSSVKTIFVFGVGNNHHTECDQSDFTGHTDLCEAWDDDGTTKYRLVARSPEFNAGLPARIAELRDLSVAVVAVGEDGAITSFSNRCGIAADWCIAAPGQNVRAAWTGGGYRSVSGTSVAAPMVTGSLAVMKHVFRSQLSNTALLARLLETADRTGVYADSTVYGKGLVDLDAATSPVGDAMVMSGTRADGPGVLLRTTGMRLGSAFGDGLRRSFAGRELVAFDRLGAPFWFRLDGFATTAAGPSTMMRLHDFLSPASQASGSGFTGGAFQPGRVGAPVQWRLGFSARSATGRASHLALANRTLSLTVAPRDGLSATAFTTEGVFGQTPTSGATFSWRPSGFPLGLRAGLLGERNTLLGGAAQGAFGGLAAGTAFVGVEAETMLGGWRLRATAESGTVSPWARGGVIDGISALITSAFTLHASRSLAAGGQLRFSLSQPLRVEQGRAAFMVPIGRTKAGQVVRLPVSAQLAPSGRQLDVAVHWQQPLALGEFRLGAVATHQPGHRATAGPVLILLSGWRWTF